MLRWPGVGIDDMTAINIEKINNSASAKHHMRIAEIFEALDRPEEADSHRQIAESFDALEKEREASIRRQELFRESFLAGIQAENARSHAEMIKEEAEEARDRRLRRMFAINMGLLSGAFVLQMVSILVFQ
jgi:hypothetical protein